MVVVPGRMADLQREFELLHARGIGLDELGAERSLKQSVVVSEHDEQGRTFFDLTVRGQSPGDALTEPPLWHWVDLGMRRA